MAELEDSADLRLDHPLKVGSALKADALDRRAFATRVTEVLQRVAPTDGLVVSVEGAWGSGKTSLLAMVEELLNEASKDERPVVVHFNPWLIGDRDALLRQFLASMAKAVKLTDHAKEGKRVAKELKTYSKAFDVLKLIPGAEPWASIVKSVVESMGNASEAVFDYKTPDLEEHKKSLEAALRKFPRRIVVLLDDLDRLYPAEAYEMVRIVKAVGDLPNVGYVLAWDERYISAALEKLNVPHAGSYLDKVVQVRLPVPPLSFPQRVKLMNRALNELPGGALIEYFPNGDERNGSLFHHGLSELIEHPRDVVRLFDVVQSIEPGLRGEIHLADIIGLASLMTKAPVVYELLCRSPQAFVGRRPGARSDFKKSDEVIAEHIVERDAAIDSYRHSKAVRRVVHWLFPKTAKADDAFTYDRVVFSEGHLAHPDRLLVALQLSARPGDLSLARVRQFVIQSGKRDELAAGLDAENGIDFVVNVGDLVEGLGSDISIDSTDLAVAVARLVEREPFVRRARERNEVWYLRGESAAGRTIGQIAQRLDEATAQALAERLIGDEVGLSVAADLAVMSFFPYEREQGYQLKAPEASRKRALALFGRNIQRAAANGELLERVSGGSLLWAFARLVPGQCKAVFHAIAPHPARLDQFVESMLQHSFDSHKGQSYALPKERDVLEKYVDVATLKKLGAERLKDDALVYPARAAWRAVVEERCIYAKDGSVNDH
ncbi:KAP family NTPase [Paucibacter sp. DJ1R-11]|uniref:KAP family P-loop NTPase fold protein n=1 Tax=Paucibacter sp. DJ1R-11 TaxID=2893556 RepID=UPI0021E46B07|nr:KAP family NTPase [Paucibacter sp. DJ1R-11]MCV2363127.1 KAP family NTPase [Paucibacter sp. DJ1R-11]